MLTEAQARALRDPGETARRFIDAGMATAMAKTASATEMAHAPLDVPQAFGLESKYPNPFSTSTSIRFALPEAGHVSLKVYDLQGRLVATLVDASREAGHHAVRWAPEMGAVPSGVYIYCLNAGGTMRARMMHLSGNG